MRPILAIMAFLGTTTLGLGFAESVSATDLTGEWKGTVRCRAFNGVRRNLPTSGATVTITQVGRYIAARIEDTQGVRHYNGNVVTQTGRDRRVEAVFIDCRSSSELNDYSEVVNLRGTVPDGRGRLAGESIFRSQMGAIGTCRWSLTRVSSKPTDVWFCQ